MTGHRNLPDSEAARRAVERLMDRIDALLADTNRGAAKADRFWRKPANWFNRALVRCANRIFRSVPVSPDVFPEETRTPVEWVVVSPLAKGADRIVAELAMNRKCASLQAVFPMSADEYRKDFAETGDLQEFDTLLARATRPVIELNPKGDVVTDKNARDRAYLRVGEAVVDASEVIIAIWDGGPSRGPGGTAEVVEYALRAGKPVLWINSKSPEDPVQRLVTREKRKDGTQTFAWNTLPMPKTGRELSPTFHALAAYNRDPAFNANEWAAHVEAIRADFTKACNDANVSSDPRRAALDPIIPAYANADLLAMRYQRLHEGSIKWLYILAASAVSVAVTQSFFLPKYPQTIIIEVVLLLAILALLRISRRENWHDKWLHDRHLAEQLRTRMFLSVLGEPESRAAVPRIEILPFYEGPSRWVQSAIETIQSRVPVATRTAEELRSIRRFLAAAWIRDQANYHTSNSKKKRLRAQTVHRIGNVIYVITIAAATLHAFGPSGHGSHSPLGNVITSLTILLPVWMANMHAISNLLERDKIAARSARMAILLGQLAREMESTSDEREIYETAHRAALVIASENHEWVISLSFRGPVLPA